MAGDLKEDIYQIHWEEISPKDGEKPKLIFVAQRGFSPRETSEDIRLWVHITVHTKKDECPDGYRPVLCDETSSYFLKAPVQP